MKKRKFDEGGGVREGKNVNINDETRAKAMEFARKADEEDREKNMQELLRSRGEGEKPRNPMRSTIEPAEPGAPAIRREVTVEPEPSRAPSTPTPRSAPAPARAKPPTDTGDETARLLRRAPEPDRGAALRETARKDEEDRAAKRDSEDRKNVADIENARGRLMSNTNRMGVRAAQQMEEKGSIYSRNFGKPRAVREAEEKASRTPLPRSQRMFQSRRKMERPTEPGGFAKGGKVSNGFSKASSRADGIAKRGKTRGRIY